MSYDSEEDEAHSCLQTLRDGSPSEKIAAREALARIFTRRGMDEEATELYEANVRAGVRSPELFERLGESYHRIGEDGAAEASLAEARRLRATSVRPAAPAETERLPAAYRYDPDEAEPPNGQAAAAVPRPRRRGLALPGPLLVLLGLVFLVILPVALLALLVVNPVALYLEGRPPGPTVEVAATASAPLKVAASTPAQLKVAPGAATNWYVHSGRSVSGLWASSGLELTLDRELDDAGTTFPVTAARPQNWGETITIVERRGQGRANQETVLPATLVAPASLPPAGTVIDGIIAGRVTAPRLSETSQFNTTADTVSVPVQLVVVSTPELWLDRFLNSLRMYFDEDRWLLVTIGALLTWCVLAGGTAILFRVRQG
ncbi:MAG: hypothetical protein IT306_09020 [Chloroflexi bacterium]|nr:hypothetical protein [Chloroflexota bacterium]